MAKREIILEISARTGDIQQRVKEIDRLLAGQREELKQLNAAYKQGELDAEQYAEAQGRIKRESADLRKEQRDLVKQLKQVDTATQAAEGSNEQLRAQLALLTREYNKLSREQRDNTKEGKDLQRQIKSLSDTLKQNEKAVGDNRRNVGNYTESIVKASGAILGPAGLLFGISSLSDVFRGAFNVFKDFDQALATLQAISGATAEELAILEGEAQRLGGTTQFTAEQVVDLQTNFARVGFDTSQIVAATEATLNLAIATGEDLATSAEVVAFTLGGYGLSAEETARVTDVMAASFNASALNLERFQEATKLVAPISKTANVSIETTTAALGALADAGLTGSIAGTGFRNVLFELSNENSKLAEKVGFAVTSSETFVEALKVLKEQGIGTTEALELIDRRGVPALLNLVENADKVDRLSNAFENAEGSAKKAADIVGDTLTGDLLRAQSALEGLAIKIGQALEPALRAIVTGFTTLIVALTELPKFIEENKVQIGLLVAGLITLNAQQIAAAASALRAAAAQKAATIATRAQAAAQRILNLVLAANPIGLIVTAVLAAAAAFVTWYQESQTLRATIAGVFESIKVVFNNFVGGVVKQFTGLKDVISGAFSLDLDQIKQGLSTIGEGIKQQTVGIGEGAGEAFGRGYNAKIVAEAEQASKDAAKATAEGGDFGGAGATAAANFGEGLKKNVGRSIKDVQDELAKLREAYTQATSAATRASIAADIKALEKELENFNKPLEDATEAAVGSLAAVQKKVSDLEAQLKQTVPGTTLFTQIAQQLRDAQKELEKTESAFKRFEAGGIAAPDMPTFLQGDQPGFGIDLPDEDEEDPVIQAAEERQRRLAEIAADNQAKEIYLRDLQATVDAEEAAADRRVQITRETEDKRAKIITSIGNAFDTAQKFAEEDSIAGKAIGIGQATIDTYVAANKALALGPPIGPILAVLTVASGLANVAKIAEVEFAEGGLVMPQMQNIPPTSSGDNVLATVRTGEVVLTPAQQVAVGGPEAFRRAKVPGFASGGIVGAAASLSSLDGNTAISERSAAAESSSAALQLQNTIKNIPAPIVTVKDIARTQNRVRVKDQTRSL